MRKYTIQKLMDDYKENGKKGKKYRAIYQKIIDATNMDTGRFYNARNWDIKASNTITSNDLIKIAVALEVTVDELLNYPAELEVKRVKRKELVPAA